MSTQTVWVIQAQNFNGSWSTVQANILTEADTRAALATWRAGKAGTFRAVRTTITVEVEPW